MRHFRVGNDIVQLVTSDITLTHTIGNRIYPLVAKTEATYPFIVYRRIGYTPDGDSKDSDGESCTVEFAVVEPRYDLCVEVASALCDCLQHAQTTNIADIQLVNSSEDFVDEANVQRLTFRVTINE